MSRRRSTERLGTDPSSLTRAVELLRAGGTVALPTETVYGLAARADDDDAVARIFAAKGRPQDNPLIVHVPTLAAVAGVAEPITPLAEELLRTFAPGPLTVVLGARPTLPRRVTAGLDSVAVRIPDHPVMLAVLTDLGVPLAAPSANRSSRPSPTTAAHVLADLDGLIDAVVDAGPTRVGLESTVVDARGELPVVLRDGGVTREQIAGALGLDPQLLEGRTVDRTADGPADGVRSPGTRHPHYVPALPVHVAARGDGVMTAGRLMAEGDLPSGPGPRGAIGLVTVGGSMAAPLPDGVVLIGAPRDATELAAGLFRLLREAEALGLAVLVVEGVDPVGLGRAVMDRLERATAASSRTA